MSKDPSKVLKNPNAERLG